MTNRPTMDRAKSAPLIGAIVIFVSLGSALISSRANEPNESDDEQSSGAAAAHALLQSLPEAKRKQAKSSFNSSERTNWNYVPTRRAGVALARARCKPENAGRSIAAFRVEPRRLSRLLDRSCSTNRSWRRSKETRGAIRSSTTRQCLANLVRVHLGRGDSKAIIFRSTRPMSTVKLKSWRRSSWARTPRACRKAPKPVCDCSRQKKIWLAI